MSPVPVTRAGRQAGGGERRPARRRVAALVLGGTLLLSLQGGLLRVALPAIRSDLGVGISGAQAVSLAGLVVACSTLVAFGHLADLVGPRRVYAWGLAAFAAGAGLSVAAPDLGWLVLAQAVQGLGWSMSVASGTALLVSVFDPAERSRAVAANHVAVAVGLAAGGAAGGVVIDQFGWRWGFAGLVPVALALAVAAAAGSAPPPERGRAPFDLRGAAALAAALVATLSLIDAGARDRLGPGGSAVAAAASAAAFAVFVRLQLRAADPVLDLRLFAHRGFSAGLAASFLNFVSMASNMFLLPFYLQDHRGLSAGRAGAVMLVMPVAIVVAAPLAGTFADRVSPRVPATAGLALIAAAVALMATFSADTSLPLVVAVMAVYGAGAGFFQSPNISAVLGSVAPDRFGVASASLATVGRLGQVVGVAVAGGLWQWGLDRHGQLPAGQTSAFRLAFAVLAVFGVLAVLASWLRGPAEPAPRIAATAAVGRASV